RRRGRVGRAERNPCQTELRSSLNRTPNPRRLTMTNHVYKHIEITGSAKTGTDDAVRNALAKAHETIRNIQWFRVVETRGHVVAAKGAHWQVAITVGSTRDCAAGARGGRAGGPATPRRTAGAPAPRPVDHDCAARRDRTVRRRRTARRGRGACRRRERCAGCRYPLPARSEEHTSELQSREKLVCRLLPATKQNV